MAGPLLIPRENSDPLTVAPEALSPEMRAKVQGMVAAPPATDTQPPVQPGAEQAAATPITSANPLANPVALGSPAQPTPFTFSSMPANQQAGMPPSPEPAANPLAGIGTAGPGAPVLPGANLRALKKIEQGQVKEEEHALTEQTRLAEDEKTAVKAAAEVEAAKDRETYQLALENQRRQDAMAAEHAQKTAAIQSHVETQGAVVQRLVDEQATKVFDPDRFMRSRGAAGQALAGISIALGALSQAYTHGQNPALGIINDAINRDIAGQKEDYERGQQGVANAQSVYSQLRAKGLDDIQAMAGARVAASEQAKLAMSTMGAKYAGPQAKANAQATIAGLEMHAAKDRHAIATQAAATATQMWGVRENARQFDTNKILQERGQDMQRRSLVADAQLKRDGENRKLLVPGVGLATSEKSAEEMKLASEAHKKANEAFDTIFSARSDSHGPIFESLSPELAGRLKTAAEQIRHGLQADYNLGTLQQNEYERLVKQVPDPTASDFTRADLGKFHALKQQLDTGWAAAVQAKMTPGTYQSPVVEKAKIP